MKLKIAIGVVLAFVFLSGIILFLNIRPEQGTTLGANTSSETPSTQSSDKSISLSEIAKHSDPQSCWAAIEGGVYDVTEFISRHPGGSRILQSCGKDATQLFNGAGGHIHSQVARAILKNLKIGSLGN